MEEVRKPHSRLQDARETSKIHQKNKSLEHYRVVDKEKKQLFYRNPIFNGRFTNISLIKVYFSVILCVFLWST